MPRKMSFKKEDVETAINELLKEGLNISNRRIRDKIGRGSLQSIAILRKDVEVEMEIKRREINERVKQKLRRGKIF